MARRQAEQQRLREEQEAERLRQEQNVSEGEEESPQGNRMSYGEELVALIHDAERQYVDQSRAKRTQQRAEQQRRVQFQDPPAVEFQEAPTVAPTPTSQSQETPPVTSQTRHFTPEEIARMNRLNESEAAHRERMSAQLEERRQELERRRQEQLATGEISQAQHDFEEQQRRIAEENERFGARRRSVMNELEQVMNPSDIQQEPLTRAATDPITTDKQFAQEFQDVPTDQVMIVLDEIVNEELDVIDEVEELEEVPESEASPELTESEINRELEGQTAQDAYVPSVETSTAEVVSTGRTQNAMPSQPVRVAAEPESVTPEQDMVQPEQASSTPEPSTTSTSTSSSKVITAENEPMSDNKKLAIILGAIILTGLSVATYNAVKKRNSRTKPDAEYSISTQQ